MIIPVKCVSCGNVLGNKYRFYVEQVRKKKYENDKSLNKVIYFSKDLNNKITPEAEVLNNLKLHNMCCRRTMLTHVDIE